MADLVTRAIIRGVDGLSAPFRAMTNNVMATQKRFTRANNALAAQARNLGFQAALPTSFLATIAGRNEYLVDRSRKMFESIATARADDIDMQRQKIAAMNTELLRVANNQRKTRLELLRGATEAITAGINVDTIKNTLSQVSKISIAVNEDLGKSYGDLTDIILGSKQYSKLFTDGPADRIETEFQAQQRQLKIITEVADTMAFAVSIANQQWKHFVSGLRQANPVASQLGIKLKETTALLGVLADAGFKGEQGGTALRTIMVRLVKPTGQAADALQAAGIKTRDMFDIDEEQFRNIDKFKERLKASGIYAGPDHVKKRIDAGITKVFQNEELMGNMYKFREAILNSLAKSIYGKKKPPQEEISYLKKSIQSHIDGSVERMDIVGTLGSLAKLSLPDLAKIFGVRRIPQAIALVENIKQYQSKLKELEAKAPGSIDRRYMVLAKGFAHNFDMMRSAIDVFWESVGASGIRAGLSKTFEGIANFFKYLQTADPTTILNVAKGLGLFIGSMVGMRIFQTIAPLAMNLLTVFSGLVTLPFAVAGTGIVKLAKAIVLFYALTTRGRVGAALASLLPRLRMLSMLRFGVTAAALGLVATNLGKIQAFVKGFSSGFSKHFAEFLNSESWAQFKQTMSDLKAAIYSLFGATNDSQMLAKFFDAGTFAAKGLLKVIEFIVKGINKIEGFYQSARNYLQEGPLRENLDRVRTQNEREDGLVGTISRNIEKLTNGFRAFAGYAPVDRHNLNAAGKRMSAGARSFEQQRRAGQRSGWGTYNMGDRSLSKLPGGVGAGATLIKPEVVNVSVPELKVHVNVKTDSGSATAKVEQVRGPASAKDVATDGASGKQN
jgi:hypothetical protein